MQRDHARDVEAAKVQGNLPTSYALCYDLNPPVGSQRLLGIWRCASDALQCICSTPTHPISRRRHSADAYPSIHHIRFRLYTTLLCLGEGIYMFMFSS